MQSLSRRVIVNLCLTPLLLLTNKAIANNELFQLSLEELINIKVSTASLQALATRHQPGTITLINRDDMNRWAPRTLADILLRTPGVSFGVDEFGLISLIFRGEWAHEGKVLLLWDDLPLNAKVSA